MGLVKAVAVVAIVVILEVVAASMLFPGVDATKAMAEELAQGDHGGDDEHAEAGDGHGAHGKHGGGGSHGAGHGDHTKELSLGNYHIVSFNPKTRTTLSVDFELFGVVLAEEEHEFTELFLVHEKRINEQVTIAFRGMELADFTDPGLGLIKRVILEKTNRALGKPLIREVVVCHFSFIPR